jgi:O-antigen ligase
MLHHAQPNVVISQKPFVRMVFSVALIAVLAAVAFAMGSSWLASEQSLKIVVAVFLLLVPLYFVLAAAKARAADTNAVTFRLTLLLWWFLLISDELFDRISNAQGMYQGQFSSDAYGEVVTWVVAFVVLLIISLARPGYLKQMFSGSYKWVSLFILSCLVSAVYSPSPLYSLGWAFKLFVVGLVLRLCISCMRSLKDARALFWATLWALLFVAILSLGEAFADPTRLFAGVGGRLNADPVVLSATAACLLMVTLTLNSIQRRLFLIPIGLFSVFVMIFAFGKTGLLAGLASATVFFLLQRKVASSIGLLASVGMLAAVLLATVTPLGNYVKLYRGAGTLTGRTELWEKAIPAIKQRSLMGHGYLASKFMWTTQTGRYAEAGHLHNGFLEALYSNGVIGLAFLLLIHAAILTNLFYAKKAISRAGPLKAGGISAADLRVGNVLVVGSVALYLNLFINGLFTVAFGGRANIQFMMFLSLLGVSMVLRQWTAPLTVRHNTLPQRAPTERPHVLVPIA